MNVEIRELASPDQAWAVRLLKQRWGSPRVVSRGHIYDAGRLPGFVARRNDRSVGLATFAIESDQCQLITIDSLCESQGIGTALGEAVADAAEASGCRRLWLVTTNDNLRALRFYQRRGFSLVAVHRDALEESREPEIPLTGHDGIPLRDEIELERLLGEP